MIMTVKSSNDLKKELVGERSVQGLKTINPVLAPTIEEVDE